MKKITDGIALLKQAMDGKASEDDKQIFLDWLEEGGISRQQMTEHPAKKGEVWIFHSVTRYIIGKIERMTPLYAILSQATWIPDEGRSMNALTSGSFNEAEPFPPGCKCVVHLGACADDEGPLPYDVPDKQK